MAVETRYVVIRTGKNNKEQEVMTFTDKRSADDHDKMLDMADALFEVLHASSVELPEQQCEELSIYLAKQRDDILFALQAKKKTAAPSSKKKTKADEKQNDMLNPEENDISPKSLSETLLSEDKAADEDTTASNKKSSKANAEGAKDDNLVDFVIEKDDAA